MANGQMNNNSDSMLPTLGAIEVNPNQQAANIQVAKSNVVHMDQNTKNYENKDLFRMFNPI
ncbi:MAG: hypothetical protein CXT75_12080 [Methanobacteriota archaeon]|nr:MAG: hypothetical protein CXT75_12080 [Euryarchaeota archaeon]